jgi:hypothetical protein
MACPLLTKVVFYQDLQRTRIPLKVSNSQLLLHSLEHTFISYKLMWLLKNELLAYMVFLNFQRINSFIQTIHFQIN